ncbi:MAG: ankyrin repeat domain-containing protein [Bacteroidota bacterium]
MSGGDWKQLFFACQKGDLELVKFYIRSGIDPNYQHPEFMTSPFLESIRCNQLDVAAFLLQNGADPHRKEGFGADDAFSIAKSMKNKAAIDLLKKMVP